MCPAQKIQALFIPKIDSSLQADSNRTLCQCFEQAVDIPANTKDFINEIDVGHATRDQAVYLLQHCIHITLAIFVPEKGLIAEGTRPWTTAGKFQFRASAFTLEDM